MQIKFLLENQSSFSFPATDDIPWVPADQLAKLSHYRPVSNAAGFLQNKSCLKLSLFCMRTDDWLNFHVMFQSIHVNITSTAHHFFFFLPFLLLHISKTCQTKKTPCQTQNKCLHTCNVYKYSEKINFLHAFNSFQPYWMSCVTCHTKHALQLKEHPKLRKCSNITLEYDHSIKNQQE